MWGKEAFGDAGYFRNVSSTLHSVPDAVLFPEYHARGYSPEISFTIPLPSTQWPSK